MNCPASKENASYSDCQVTGYLVQVAFTFIPGILWASATLFFIPYFYCARYCCGCCGSSQQTEGVCCACGNTPAARYSWFEILRVRVYSVFCAVFSAVSIAYGVAAAAKGKIGLIGLVDSLSGIPRVLVSEIDSIQQALTVQLYNFTTDSFVTYNIFTETAAGRDLNSSVRSVSTDMEKTITNQTDTVKNYLDLIMTLVFVFLILPACLMGLNTVFAFLNVRSWGPMINSLLLLFLSFILWTVHSVVATTGLIISDVCAEVKGLADQEKNVVSALISCPTSLLDSARKSFAELETKEATSACEKMNSTCVIPTSSDSEFADNVKKGRIFDCPDTFLDCKNATFARLLNYSENGMKINSTVSTLPNATDSGFVCRDTNATNCSLARCADYCTFANGTRSETGKASAVAVSAFRAAATVARVFADIGAKFYVCESLLSLIAGPMAEPCADSSQGLFDCYMASGMELMFIIFSVYVCSWGSKRFIPFEEAGKLQGKATSNKPFVDDGKERPIPTQDKVVSGFNQ